MLLGLVIVPFFVNFLVRTIGWLILLSPNGPVSSLLQRWGIRSEPLHLLQTRSAVQLGVVYNYLALMILPLFVALDRLDPAMREASKDLGASRWKTFRQVTLPLAAPGIVAGLLLVFIPLTGDYITALVLGGAKGNMAGVMVASRVHRGAELGARSRAGGHPDRPDHGNGRRLRVDRSPRSDDRASEPEDHAPRGGGGDCMSTVRVARPRRQRDGASLALRVWAIVVYVFLFLPILVIVIYSFNNGRSMLTWSGIGLDGYRTGITDPTIQDAVRTSIVAAAGTALIATVLGSLAGIALARRKGKWTVLFLALVFLILVTPEIVDAIALLIWYVRLGGPFGPNMRIPGVSYGMIRLWVGHSLFATAVVTLIVRARLLGLEETLEEAAADLYATPWRRFRQITLPLMLPAVLAGAFLSFSFSLDDTIISSFVSVAGASPWPVYVFSAVRNVLRPQIASVSTLLLLLTLFAIGCVAIVLRRGGQSGEEVAKTMTVGG